MSGNSRPYSLGHKLYKMMSTLNVVFLLAKFSVMPSGC